MCFCFVALTLDVNVGMNDSDSSMAGWSDGCVHNVVCDGLEAMDTQSY